MTVTDNAAALPATAPNVARGRTVVLRDGSMVWIRQVQAAALAERAGLLPSGQP